MNELKVTSILSRQIAPLLIVSVGLPIVVLAGVGLYFVFQHGYLLFFLAALAASQSADKTLFVVVPSTIDRSLRAGGVGCRAVRGLV